MIRLEVVANRSIQEDFFDRLAEREVGAHHTLFPEVQGVGNSGPRQGDHVWPEENFVFVSYVGREEARAIKEIVDGLKEVFSEEGIKIFATEAAEL